MEQSHRATIIAIVGVVFFTALFVFYFQKALPFPNTQSSGRGGNNTVVFVQPTLTIFDKQRLLNEFPDTIRIHYPYVLVVVPEEYKQITTVYDVETQRQNASINQIALDYTNGNFLYNQYGITTYFNKRSLGLHCASGFIKARTDIRLLPK